MRRVMWSLLAVLGLGTTSQAAIMADVVFVIDESGSMGGVQANVRNNIGTFASILSAGGVDAQYALVGYGHSGIRPRLLTDLTTPGAFALAANGLLTNGGTEPAYEGIMSALNGGPTLLAPPISFRAGAVKNIIIVTDEPSNGDLFGANWLNADALLKSNNALLNGILTPGSAGGLTPPTQSLGTLVLGNGGAVFSLNTFNTNNQATIDAFVQDFANRKLQEILDAGGQIPEPATLAVFGGIAVAGLFGYRRRKTTATA